MADSMLRSPTFFVGAERQKKKPHGLPAPRAAARRGLSEKQASVLQCSRLPEDASCESSKGREGRRRAPGVAHDTRGGRRRVADRGVRHRRLHAAERAPQALPGAGYVPTDPRQRRGVRGLLPGPDPAGQGGLRVDHVLRLDHAGARCPGQQHQDSRQAAPDDSRDLDRRLRAPHTAPPARQEQRAAGGLPHRNAADRRALPDSPAARARGRPDRPRLPRRDHDRGDRER
mmetsp:Transcript_50899/g.143276  ORF Transcript_50899/g.143276 Transcript_50899/m.143276 type:complete len:230 (-) Transcript_50899:733-1422(-)